MSVYFHADSCPQLETIVRSTVDAALQQNVLTAGLLRSSSTTASAGLRRVHPAGQRRASAATQRGPAAGGAAADRGHPGQGARGLRPHRLLRRHHRAGHPRRRQPGRRPGHLRRAAGPPRQPRAGLQQRRLHAPAAQLHRRRAHLRLRRQEPRRHRPRRALRRRAHRRQGALQLFGDIEGPAGDDITRCITETCTASGSADRLRDLDFLTPSVFDNLYFIELTLKKNKGVMLPSDQVLATDPRTSWLVQGFADNHWWFFDQFKASMIKMSQLQGPQGNVGEIRSNCFRVNSGAAAATVESGLAASA
ncbi:hypothetical protein BS78_05G147200 [Paspalum vaginatum]|nr:hypothetical protein BS78_05G147200 [Paspalum vaginatum]